MAVFKLADTGFTLIPEGKHILQVESVEYEADTGVIFINYVSKEGYEIRDRFQVHYANGEANEVPMTIFSRTAKTLLNDPTREDVDTEELIGKFLEAVVVHVSQPNRNDPTRTVRFANIKERYPSTGWDAEDQEDYINQMLEG